MPARRRSATRPGARIGRVWREPLEVYGARKVWRQLKREGFEVARRTVERLMKRLGLAGVIRGKPVKTTRSDKAASCPLDRVNRDLKAPAPNRLWGEPLSAIGPRTMASDFTYVRIWTGVRHRPRTRGGLNGSLYTAFVIDVFARRIVGWKGARSPTAQCVLDALEQALHERRPFTGTGLVHHSDRGVPHLAIAYNERLADAGVEPSVGSVGDSCDNARAQTIIGLYKAEAIERGGPWRRFEDVEMATLEWVDRFNNRRLLGPIGNTPPAEAEAACNALLAAEKIAA